MRTHKARYLGHAGGREMRNVTVSACIGISLGSPVGLIVVANFPIRIVLKDMRIRKRF